MRALSIPAVGVVTVSCGAAELDMPGAALSDGLARADAAMYDAKRGGRDRAVLHREAADPAALPESAQNAPR